MHLFRSVFVKHIDVESIVAFRYAITLFHIICAITITAMLLPTSILPKFICPKQEYISSEMLAAFKSTLGHVIMMPLPYSAHRTLCCFCNFPETCAKRYNCIMHRSNCSPTENPRNITFFGCHGRIVTCVLPCPTQIYHFNHLFPSVPRFFMSEYFKAATPGQPGGWGITF